MDSIFFSQQMAPWWPNFPNPRLCIRWWAPFPHHHQLLMSIAYQCTVHRGKFTFSVVNQMKGKLLNHTYVLKSKKIWPFGSDILLPKISGSWSFCRGPKTNWFFHIAFFSMAFLASVHFLIAFLQNCLFTDGLFTNGLFFASFYQLPFFPMTFFPMTFLPNDLFTKWPFYLWHL